MDSEKPVRFTVPMRASFKDKVTRDQAIGQPMRWRLEDSVMMQGIVVDWADEEDGSVTLTVEGASPTE